MTKTEQAIQELWKTVSRLEERVDNARSDIKDVESEVRGVDERRMRSVEILNEIDRRLGLIEENVKEWKKTADENDRRRWAVILAMIGSFLTLAVNLALLFFKSNR